MERIEYVNVAGLNCQFVDMIRKCCCWPIWGWPRIFGTGVPGWHVETGPAVDWDCRSQPPDRPLLQLLQGPVYRPLLRLLQGPVWPPATTDYPAMTPLPPSWHVETGTVVGWYCRSEPPLLCLCCHPAMTLLWPLQCTTLSTVHSCTTLRNTPSPAGFCYDPMPQLLTLLWSLLSKFAVAFETQFCGWGTCSQPPDTFFG